MSSDQYCLRWNSYESNILATFENLLDSEALSDVTLFCEGDSFKAHRLVLAACSTHFSKIFANAPLNGQLIVILDGTRSLDLQILLQFMYRGVAFLPSDRIESVLRTGEVLQVKGLFNADGLTGRGGGSHNSSGSSNNTWSSPTHTIHDNQKKEAPEPPTGGRDRRDSSSPVPTGRIAVPPPAESPLSAHHPLPLFTQQAPTSGGYPRPPFPPLPPALYQSFPGFQRPDSANSKATGAAVTPTPSSAMSFSSKSELPSPSHTPGGGRESTNSQYKFSPRRGGDRDNDHYEGSKQELGRSPALRRSSSDAFGEQGRCNGSPPPALLRGAKQLMSSDSTTGADPSQSPSRRFPGEPSAASSAAAVVDRLRLKTEMPSSPVERKRTFSGEYSSSGGRGDSLSRLSSSTASGLPLGRSEAAEDLRTNDTEERIKRENNFETLRRLAHVNAVAASGGGGGGGGGGLSDRESQLATIQKMDILRQAAVVGRDHFLGGRGGFSAPLTAPLGIPASDLARIAQTVPDPAAASGEPTSGTGTKLKCPFCERTYGYETNLRAHIRQRHQGIRVPCPFCHRSFTRNNTVRRHIAREHRHQVNPKMIPTKFGQTKVHPDQPYSDAMNQPQP